MCINSKGFRRISNFDTWNVLLGQIDCSPTFLRAKDAVWPPRTSLTGILLRWMDLTAIGMKVPSGSGPKSNVSLSRIIPRNVVPDTTVPTPYQERTKTECIRVCFYKCKYSKLKKFTKP